jgi:hypothetical protein
LNTDITGVSQDIDAETTFGISGSLDYFVSPSLAIGANPGLIFGLKGKGAMSSATQLDLRARARFGNLGSDGFAIHGYVTVGSSSIYLPLEVTSSGGTLGFGLAASSPLNDSNFITFDVGYQIGAQSVAVGDTDVEVSSNLLHVGIGVGSFL